MIFRFCFCEFLLFDSTIVTFTALDAHSLAPKTHNIAACCVIVWLYIVQCTCQDRMATKGIVGLWEQLILRIYIIYFTDYKRWDKMRMNSTLTSSFHFVFFLLRFRFVFGFPFFDVRTDNVTWTDSVCGVWVRKVVWLTLLRLCEWLMRPHIMLEREALNNRHCHCSMKGAIKCIILLYSEACQCVRHTQSLTITTYCMLRHDL